MSDRNLWTYEQWDAAYRKLQEQLAACREENAQVEELQELTVQKLQEIKAENARLRARESE